MNYSEAGVFMAISPEDKMVLAEVGEEGYCVKYLLKRDFIRSHSLCFDESLHIGEDLVFSLQAVYHANKVIRSSKALYMYKHRSDSAVNTFNRKLKRQRKEALQPVRTFVHNFQEKYHLQTVGVDPGVNTVYYLFGLPILKSRVFKNGDKKWYFLGIGIVRIKLV